jgi:hypothetical protein
VFKKILAFSLPLYLYGLEYLLKALASINSDSVAGPTLAGAALSFLLPLTEFRSVSVPAATRKRLSAIGADAHLEKDKTFVDLVWLVFFVSLGGWMLCIDLTLRPLRLFGTYLNDSFIIGSIIYVGSVVLTIRKERL